MTTPDLGNFEFDPNHDDRLEKARRNATGDYGVAEICGKRIEPGRFAMNPFATDCIYCANPPLPPSRDTSSQDT